MLKKSTLREIRSSLGRYLAILAIVMLGVGFFCGLKSTKPAMLATADQYLKDNKLYDYQLQSTLGLTEKDAEAVARQDDVEAAEGSVSEDVLFHYDGQESDKVLRFHSITSKVNTIHLMKGRLPKAKDECVVDYYLGNDLIGKKIVISSRNSKRTRDLFYRKELKVVGTVTSPVYLNFERGTTSLGDGKVSGFVYMNRDAFDTDVFTQIEENQNRQKAVKQFELDKEQSELENIQQKISVMENNIPNAMTGDYPLSLEELVGIIRKHKELEQKHKRIVEERKAELDAMKVSMDDWENIRSKIPTWQDVFWNADTTTKRVLVNKLIERIDITKDSVNIRFKINLNDFFTLPRITDGSGTIPYKPCSE